jgi:hypothetical protein
MDCHLPPQHFWMEILCYRSEQLKLTLHCQNAKKEKKTNWTEHSLNVISETLLKFVNVVVNIWL